MTLLNAWARGDTALIAVDTECVVGTQRGHAEKLAVLPSSRAVLACRGVLAFFNLVAQTIATLRLETRSLDAIAALMPQALPELWRNLPTVVAAYGLPPTDPGPQTLVLLGWSDDAQRMVLHEYEIGPDGVKHDTPVYHVAPWHESIDRLTNARTVPAIIDLAESQIRLMRELAPDAAAGGALIVGHLSKTSISVSVVHQLTAGTGERR